MSTAAPALTAAEKAELRRHKILAKKKARMAYAAGKRKELPSAAPPEPQDEVRPHTTIAPSTTTVNDDAHPQAQRNSHVPNVLRDHSSLFDPFMRAPLERSLQQQGKRNPLESALAVLNEGLVRLILLSLLAASYSGAVTYNYITRWRVSAVELFVSAELCLLVPEIVGAFRVRSKGRMTGDDQREAFPFTVLRLLSNIQDSVLLIRKVLNDFCIFMFAFLCTWYLFELLP